MCIISISVASQSAIFSNNCSKCRLIMHSKPIIETDTTPMQSFVRPLRDKCVAVSCHQLYSWVLFLPAPVRRIRVSYFSANRLWRGYIRCFTFLRVLRCPVPAGIFLCHNVICVLIIIKYITLYLLI